MRVADAELPCATILNEAGHGTLHAGPPHRPARRNTDPPLNWSGALLRRIGEDTFVLHVPKCVMSCDICISRGACVELAARGWVDARTGAGGYNPYLCCGVNSTELAPNVDEINVGAVELYGMCIGGFQSGSHSLPKA